MGVFVIWLVCPLDRPFPLTPGSSPGQVLTLSHDGDHCKTRWYGQRRDLDDFPGTPCEFASLARVPFAERRGGPPLSFGHFPRRAGANPTPPPSGGFAVVSRWGEGIFRSHPLRACVASTETPEWRGCCGGLVGRAGLKPAPTGWAVGCIDGEGECLWRMSVPPGDGTDAKPSL